VLHSLSAAVNTEIDLPTTATGVVQKISSSPGRQIVRVRQYVTRNWGNLMSALLARFDERDVGEG
jgi:hypothetical protein